MYSRMLRNTSVVKAGLAVIMTMCFITLQANAQFKEDALRLSTEGFGVGARALGMGNAYTGVANDYSALYWNPAGLAQATYGEFSFGLSYLNNQDKSKFFGGSQTYSNNATNLNTLGIVYPVPVRRGSLALAFGFNRHSNFTSGLSFSGYNPQSSIVQTYAPNGGSYPDDLSGNIAYQLYLADIDTSTGTFISPINGRVTQSGKVTETGGLNDWSIGGALDIAKNVSVGLTVTYLSGSYRYDRSYKEENLQNAYAAPWDFKDITIEDFIESDISGINAKLGLMYRVPDRFRFGMTIKTPTAYTIKEDFGTTASSSYYTPDKQGKTSYGPLDFPGSTEYDVKTPWVFGLGASVNLRDLMISGDLEYTDWTEMEFSKANQDVMKQNKDIKDVFRPTANLRGGLEYAFTGIGLRVRGGFIYRPSPYKGDPSTFDQKYATGGLGVLLGESSMLDLGYARGWWDTFRVNYDGPSRVDEKITTNTILLTFTHRF